MTEIGSLQNSSDYTTECQEFSLPTITICTEAPTWTVLSLFAHVPNALRSITFYNMDFNVLYYRGYCQFNANASSNTVVSEKNEIFIRELILERYTCVILNNT